MFLSCGFWIFTIHERAHTYISYKSGVHIYIVNADFLKW